jgi:hypothetical protein
MTGPRSTEPLELHVPDELPALDDRAARALLELLEALEGVELDDDAEAVA